ncbi:hypothetical protein M8C21_022654 [Ambrosia artemisiifolia]|uniref:Uncharacterized protein n=1 Tax=Ambrosia artemisiifolia TaxID=4212 RepID=A0AAD5GLH3_AMBAR|nr:hypothetical protein M8C21_022654 [Ambrosia artemisiifolia]
MLQKVLQLYASKFLSKRSYATKGNEVLKAEQCLEEIIKVQMNCAHLENCLHKAREEAQTHLCETNRSP